MHLKRQVKHYERELAELKFRVEKKHYWKAYLTAKKLKSKAFALETELATRSVQAARDFGYFTEKTRDGRTKIWQ